MVGQLTLGAAQWVWEMLWDRGMAQEKEEKDSKKTK
jgi:hypothetical protein